MNVSHVANLKSKQGRNIVVDYVTQATANEDGPTIYKANVMFRVDGFPNERITAVLINQFFIPGDESLSETVYIQELSGNDGVFSFTLSELVDINLQVFGSDFTQCYPQIAVVIDGDWQIDPIQPGEQHNFNFAWKTP